jgi:hypothetical protein
MKSHVHAFICASCGGTLTGDDHESTITCPWCKTDNFLAGDDLPRSYWIEPVLDQSQAVREVRRSTGRPEVEKGFSEALRIERKELVFLPFNAVRAIRTGRMLISEKKPDRASMYQRDLGVADSMWGAGVRPMGVFGTLNQIQSEPQPVRDTKILFAEIVLSEPACDAAELGAREVAFERNVFGNTGLPLKPYNRRAIADTGCILEPERHPRALVRKLDEAGRGIVPGTDRKAIESIGVQLYQVFYPVWVVRGIFDGRSQRFVVDALDGTLLAGRVPASRTHRAAVATAGIFLAGAPVALMLRAVIWWIGFDRGGSLMSGDLFMLGLLATGLLLASGWGLMVMGWVAGSFRMSHELVVKGGELTEDVIGLPGRGALEKLGLRLLEWSDRTFSVTSRAARDG